MFFCWGFIKVVFVCVNLLIKFEVLLVFVELLDRVGFVVKWDKVFVVFFYEMVCYVGVKFFLFYCLEDVF